MIVVLLAHLAGTVSIDNPGIRLELFLKELSKQSGTEFHCPVYLNNEVLAASFQDQSIDIVKSQLARVIHGTWEKKNDGWWLTQTGTQKKEESNWARSIRNNILQSQLDALRAIAPKQEWTSKDAEAYWREVQEMRQKIRENPSNLELYKPLRLTSAESRFAGTLATLVKPEMFNGDPILGRYTVRGLSGHVELPIQTDEALNRFNTELQMYRQVSQSIESNQPVKHFEMTLQPGEVPVISIEFYDQKWGYVASGIPSLYIPDKLTAKGETYSLSPETKEVLDLLAEMDDASRTTVLKKHAESKVLQDATDTFLEATKRDPLGIKQGRCWIDFARSVKKPMLVSMEDDDGELRPKLVVPTVDQSEFTIGMKREDADGWVLGRPVNPEFNRNRRTDRGMIEGLAKLLTDPAHNTLDIQLKTKPIGTFIEHYKNRIPNDPFLYDYMNDGSVILGILGSLAPGQLESCLKGNPLPTSAFPTDARYYLSCSAALGMLNELSPRLEKGGLLTCPLYLLPNGITGVTMNAALRNEPEFVFFVNATNKKDSPLSLAEYAERTKSFLEKSIKPPDSFSVRTKRVLTTTFSLNGKSKDFRNTEPGGELSPTYTWETLPDSIKDQVLERMKTLPPDRVLWTHDRLAHRLG